MNFNSSTYNSVQNFGTDYYLGRDGNAVQSSSTNTAWQVGACNNSTNTNVFIRTGNLCLVPQTNASLSLIPCTASLASWQLSYANGQSVGDGLYLRYAELSGTRYLSSELGPPPVVLMAIKPAGNTVIPEFAWAFREIPRGSWPDGGPLSVDFCSSAVSSTSTMAQSSSVVLPVTSSAAISRTTSTASTVSSASTASTISSMSTGSTVSSASTSSPTSTSRSSVASATQQSSSSSAPVATPSSSDVGGLTLSKPLFLAVVGLSVCLQLL